MKTKNIFAVTCAVLGVSLSMPVAAETVEEHAERRMRAMDSNGDRVVSLEEFTEFRSGWASRRDDADRLMNPRTVQRAFDRIDDNGDGNISWEELLEETSNMSQHRGS